MSIEQYLDLLESGVSDSKVIKLIERDYGIKCEKIKTGGSLMDMKNKLFNGKLDYSPKVKDIINKFGNDEIRRIEVIRKPVNTILLKALSALSFGQFEKRVKESGYDALYHLQLIVKTVNDKNVLIEKNEIINMDLKPKKSSDSEVKRIDNVRSGLTINMLLEGARQIMGDKAFFKYDGSKSNCQDFAISLINGSNLNNPQVQAFVKQDTKRLFEGLSFMRKFANTTTDIGAVAQVVMQGGKIRGKRNLKNNYLI